METSASVSDRALFEVYYPPFQAAIDAGVACLSEPSRSSRPRPVATGAPRYHRRASRPVATARCHTARCHTARGCLPRRVRLREVEREAC